MVETVNKQQAIIRLCEQLMSSSQVTTRAAVRVKDVGKNLTQLAKTQNQQITDALGTTNTISRSMQQSVEHVDHANSELTLLLNSLLEKTVDLEEIQCLIREIGESSKKIDELAFQSKMLSLNASIEVAKIGSAGKGLAVVASEIKSLAITTDEASNQIKDAIDIAANKIKSLVIGNKETVDFGLLKIQKSEMAIEELKAVYGSGTVTDEASIQILLEKLKALNSDANQTDQTSQSLLNHSDTLNAEVEIVNRLVSDLIGEAKGEHIIDIDVNQAYENLDDYKIIDVRRGDEFNDELGHIQTANLYTIDENFYQKIKDLDKSFKYLFVCRSGGRSARAAREAQGLGFGKIYNLQGGMLAWKEANLKSVYTQRS